LKDQAKMEVMVYTSAEVFYEMSEGIEWTKRDYFSGAEGQKHIKYMEKFLSRIERKISIKL